MNFWIKNTRDEKSASLTFVIITFAVTIAWWVSSLISPLPLDLVITPFDATEAMLILGPLLGLYFGRRHTESQERIKSNEQ